MRNFATSWTLVDNHFVDELERFDIQQNQLEKQVVWLKVLLRKQQGANQVAQVEKEAWVSAMEKTLDKDTINKIL